jgi:basic amino acid/polyamine antiporter, APA family
MNFSKLFRTKSFNDIQDDENSGIRKVTGLKRNLSVRDLTALGVAAIIGAGIFSTIGNAASNGGPAVSLLFVFTALACGLSALCYAQFASSVPLSGSAYTYSYTTFGEIIAWIIGWDLIMEYSIGNIAVAISWSDYFTSLLSGVNIHFPAWLSVDYLSAYRIYPKALHELSSGTNFNSLNSSMQEAYYAWTAAPVIGGIRIIADLPAFMITVLITTLVYIGINETKIASNIMVLLKVSILLVIIAVGAFYVKPGNWHPFAPNGLGGVLKGVSAVFFAYIGFDAISTTAEECKNPQKDLPRSMLYSLAITTVLYVLIALILTGMVNYKELAVGDPLAFVFNKIGLSRLSGIIAVSAVIAMASVLLVFQVGQPRIWMSMSRDGLLPSIFSRIHPRFKTPSFSTIITGIIVAVPSLFLNLTEVTDLTSIGTLFAFVLVCGGILILDQRKDVIIKKGRFKIPYINSSYILPIIWFVFFIMIVVYREPFFSWLFPDDITVHRLPQYIYFIIAFVLSLFSIMKHYSLIPVLGLLTNLYLMSELGITNWLRFIIWLIIGLAIYFSYGIWNSKLRKRNV